jgi:hypothetical protein
MNHPPSTLDDLPWDLLDRYCAGETTPEESARIRSSLTATPDHARLFERLLYTLDQPPSDFRPANVNAMLAAVHQRLGPSAALKRLARTIFESSPDHAVAALLDLDDSALNQGEIQQLQCLIEQAKRKER